MAAILQSHGWLLKISLSLLEYRYDVASSAKRAHLEAGGVAAVVRLQPCLLRMAAVCVAIGLEAMAALQLAQPSLGKMAVKEPAQPFWWYIPRLAGTGFGLLQ